MVVNEDACDLDKRGAFESIAGKPAPTTIARPLVGASLLAMVVNDNAYNLDKRGAFESIAGKSAPTTIARPLVGASLLAMVVNDNAYNPDERGACACFPELRAWPFVRVTQRAECDQPPSLRS
jgi:uncharacterized iron-regulated membrane protein